MTRPFRDRIRLSCPVARVRRRVDGVTLLTRDGESRAFDHVVLACHSDQALGILDPPTPVELEVLGAIRYQRNTVVLHTDTSVLPRRRRAWASWNHLVGGETEVSATVTYQMNILQGLEADEAFCVSLNQAGRIDPARVIRYLRYEHPVFDLDADGARRRRRELVSANRTSFCGAYWGYGFHEDGVRSALEVARSLSGSPTP